jgi:hypothetical protein
MEFSDRMMASEKYHVQLNFSMAFREVPNRSATQSVGTNGLRGSLVPDYSREAGLHLLSLVAMLYSDPQFDPVVRCVDQILLRSEVSLRCLH